MARPHAKTQSMRVSGGRVRYERTHEDDIYSGMLHVRVHDRAVVVGGLSAVRFETTEVFTRIRDFTGPFEGPSPGPGDSGWSPGVVVGWDLTAFRWTVFSIGPSVRVFIYLHRDFGGSTTPHFGYGNYAVRVGGRIQTRF
jgi:hypothetical protein